MLRDFWGVDESEIPQFNFMSTVHPEDIKDVGETMMRAIERRQSAHLFARYKNARGEYRIIETDARPRISPWGRVPGYDWLPTSISLSDTRPSRRFQTVKKGFDWRRRLPASAPGIWTSRRVKATGIKTAVSIFGLDPDSTGPDCTRDNWFELIHEADRKRVRQRVRSIVFRGLGLPTTWNLKELFPRMMADQGGWHHMGPFLWIQNGPAGPCCRNHP